MKSGFGLSGNRMQVRLVSDSWHIAKTSSKEIAITTKLIKALLRDIVVARKESSLLSNSFNVNLRSSLRPVMTGVLPAGDVK